MLGAAGAGRRLKLINNLLFAANLNLAAEALGAAAQLGLDPVAAALAMERSSGGSYAMRKFAEAGGVDAVMGAVRRYLEKDVALAQAAAAEHQLDLPLLAHAAAPSLAAEAGQ